MKRVELLLPFLILSLGVGIFLPLPPSILDILLTVNLVVSVTLLLTSLTITNPLSLSSLPMLLLITTLFRLSLNIATTRSILTSGNGGKLVDFFGEIVTGGNLIVGTIIFLIITLVQFLVIAKGSERVAEVSARFALDALPGKQMSIDADVRAGLIDFETARQRRIEVGLESKLYGSLDGAMKFVKGDAIAGFIIVLINGFGGIALGALAGMPIRESVSHYTLLSIGDGLLSQIASFLNAVAAGLIVTRVSKEHTISPLNEMLMQITQCKSLIKIVSAACILIAFIPKIPFLPFFGISLVLFGLSFYSEKILNHSPQKNLTRFKPTPQSICSLNFKKDSVPNLNEASKLISTLEIIREQLFNEMGLIIPPIELNFSDKNSVVIKGEEFSFEFIDQDLASQNNLLIIKEILHKNLALFCDDVATRRILDCYENSLSEIITNLIPNKLTITQVTQILKALLEEKISIRQIDKILQTILENQSKNQRLLLEEIRVQLSFFIKKSLQQRFPNLICYRLSPLVEYSFSEAEKKGELVNSDLAQELTSYFKDRDYSQFIVTTKGARALVRDYLKYQGIGFEIYSEEEIVGLNYSVLEVFEFSNNDLMIERLAA